MPPEAKRWRLTKSAKADLEAIWFYTCDRWNEEKANEYASSIRDAILQLAVRRLRGRKAAYPSVNYLYYHCGSHNIFFREEKTRIVVVRILHERMDFKRHL